MLRAKIIKCDELRATARIMSKLITSCRSSLATTIPIGSLLYCSIRAYILIQVKVHLGSLRRIFGSFSFCTLSDSMSASSGTRIQRSNERTVRPPSLERSP